MDRVGWDERHRLRESGSDTPAPLLLEAVKSITPGDALDLASGAGRNALFLASLGWKVTAVDFSSVAISILRERAEERRLPVSTRIANLEAIEFEIVPESWDLVCDFFYLQRDLFPSIREGIRSGGFFVATIHVENPAGEPSMNPAWLLTPGELRSMFPGWEVLHDCEKPVLVGGHGRRVAELVVRKP